MNTIKSGRGRGLLLLVLFWTVLVVRVGYAIARGESLKEDALALPMLALIVSSAILGSVAYSAWLKRRLTTTTTSGAGARE